MRILVMGAGAVGGYYGGRLAERGHAVTLVARGPHLEALRARGLVLRAGGRTRRIAPVDAQAAPPARAPAPEVVLFTVKGGDTESAALALRPALGPATVVLTLQNGVDALDRLAAVLEPGCLLVGTTVIEVAVVEPGVIEQGGPPPRIALGEPSGAVTLRVEAIAALLRDTGAEVTVTADARRAVWEKFVRLAPGASVTAACGAPIGAVRDDPEGASLYRALVTEAVLVGRAAGVALPADAVDAALLAIGRLPAAMKTSMQRDFERGRRGELEELTGAVVRLGRRLGVATPAFDAIYAILTVRAGQWSAPPAAGAASAPRSHQGGIR